jgi:hypothetical protein
MLNCEPKPAFTYPNDHRVGIKAREVSAGSRRGELWSRSLERSLVCSNSTPTFL